MKHINYILALAIATLSLVACDVSENHVPGEAFGIGVQAYINQEMQTSYTYKPTDEQVLNIPIYRENHESAATVHFDVTDPDYAFNVPTTLKFEAGESVKNLQVTFDITLGEVHQFTVTIAKGEVFTYGAPSLTFKVMRDYNWIDAGTALVTSAWVGNTQPIEVPVQKREGVTENGSNNLYRLYSPYFIMEPEYCPTEGASIQFYVDDKFNAVELPELQAMGYQDAANGLGNLYIYWKDVEDVTKVFTNVGNAYTIFCPMVCDRFSEGEIYLLSYTDGSGIFTETIEFVWNR
ncbi:hypothetical protein [Bacteroides timonensis]|uniref:hypothetical protein n=1 Tax=Bacteroides timonensis TaxID=1470345 RepID=UPI00069327A9|nr:hypothetical protein [Bacteroides timonensis]